jgi:hypothetical protein
LTVPEVVVGGAILALSVSSWMALLLLDNHVGWLGAVSVTAAGALVVLLAVAFFAAHRPALRLDPWSGLILAVVVALAAVFFFPGFHYGATDKDPGGYIEIGAAFARHGSYSFRDTLGARVAGLALQDPGARFPAIWLRSDNLVVPQFYHLWPALLAMAYDIGGLHLEVQAAPLAALLAVAAFVLLLRRILPHPASAPAALVGGALLATNMLEVWQAKYPTTEALAQMIFVMVLLCVTVTLQTGWAPAAGFAGLLLGIGWLERPDVLVGAAVVAGVGAVLVALRRWGRRCWWFLGGFAVTLPHVLWQAYAGAAPYTIANHVPRLSTIVIGAVALYALAFGVRAVRPLAPAVLSRLQRRHWQFGLGLLLCAVTLAMMALGFLRPRLFGAAYELAGGQLVRSFNEQNMRRLSWFITFPGWALVGLGVAAIALRRWRASLWVPLVPALLITPLYVQNARIAPQLMWWGRRFVPEVLPCLLILIVVALTSVLLLRRRVRNVLAVPALGLAVYLLVSFVTASAPLRHHDELAGSFRVTAEIAATAGHQRGIYLFATGPCCAAPEELFGGAMWLERREYSAILPPAGQPSYVARIAAAFPRSPIFVIVDGSAPPPGLLGDAPTAALHVHAALPEWQETDFVRPDADGPPILLDFTVWRLAVP